MHELAHKLVDNNTNDHLKQDLWDYTTLLDGVLETEGQNFQQHKSRISKRMI
jgi:hypothetical protein